MLQSAELDMSTAYNQGASLLVRGKLRRSKTPLIKPALLRYIIVVSHTIRCSTSSNP